MNDVRKVDYGKAEAEAEQLAELVRDADSLDPVYAKLDGALEELRAEGQNAADLLPADAEPGIGFMLNQKRDGKTLWQAIAVAGRESLCDPEGELRKLFAQGGQFGSGSLVASVMFALGLPAIAVPIAVAIAGVILAVGIQGFCRWASAPADDPAPA